MSGGQEATRSPEPASNGPDVRESPTSATGLEPPVAGEPRTRRVTSLELLCVLLLAAMLFQDRLVGLLDAPALRTGATVFVAICVQALPFLVLGVLISGLIAAFLPPKVLRRLLPGNEAAGVPVAGLAGLALPGCECASVPVARRMMQQGIAPSAALVFLLAAPAINPIVLVSTAVAFPGEPLMVLARFLASLLTAMVMGWLWIKWGRTEWIAERALRRLPDQQAGSRWVSFVETVRHDLVEAGGYLVLGGLAAAVLNVAVPASWLDSLGGQVLLAVIVMALAAVLLALCSEADAFVVASLPGLPLPARLAFLVVGPAVDIKLIAMQAGTFGRSFAARFAPATFLVAVLSAVLVSALLLEW
ncbi:MULTISPECIES: permease [Actinoalloteichus]|uniref:Permease n=1 Tax=Actinoalloteichus fjordicus TaxID=1612552 RepID=A0AAC9PUA6_9PSEU|nr:MULTISPECIES: permease [Actinoalloteichus]APU16897.1 putative permease [Actinoalloteichus fjordicus]APU22977.1 putative permease [Actinoalloteichus sp. GBA129-24]